MRALMNCLSLKRRPTLPTALGLLGSIAAAPGVLVQITQTNNSFSTNLLSLDPDLTGDGSPELILRAARLLVNSVGVSSMVSAAFSAIGGGYGFGVASVKATLVKTSNSGANGLQNSMTPAPATLTDTNFVTGSVILNTAHGSVNGGAPQAFVVQFKTEASDSSAPTVKLERIVFDDGGGGIGGFNPLTTYPEYAPIPEPNGFALGLLAVGASGIMARRRRRQHGTT